MSKYDGCWILCEFWLNVLTYLKFGKSGKIVRFKVMKRLPEFLAIALPNMRFAMHDRDRMQ